MESNKEKLSGKREFVFTRPDDPSFRRTASTFGSSEALYGRIGRRNPVTGKVNLNSVFHRVEISEPVAYPYWGTGGWFLPNLLPNRDHVDGGTLAFWNFPEVKDPIDSITYSELNKLENSLQPLDTNFSLLNFLNELREFPSLLDPAKVSIKRLAIPSTRKVKKVRLPKRLRSKVRGKYVDDALRDFGDTFVNGQFGYLPTISDASELKKRFGNLESAFTSLKEKLKPKSFKRYARFDKSFYKDYEAQFGIKFRVHWKVSGILRIRGKAERSVPLLNTLGPLLSTLEQGGVRLNLGVIWNAIPFSWAVDWFVPVGDFMEKIGQRDALGIQVKVRGMYTWKLKASAIIYPKEVSSTHPDAQQELPGFNREVFVANARCYHRRALPESLDPWMLPPFRTNNNWSATKAGIAAAIANGFRK